MSTDRRGQFPDRRSQFLTRAGVQNRTLVNKANALGPPQDRVKRPADASTSPWERKRRQTGMPGPLRFLRAVFIVIFIGMVIVLLSNRFERSTRRYEGPPITRTTPAPTLKKQAPAPATPKKSRMDEDLRREYVAQRKKGWESERARNYDEAEIHYRGLLLFAEDKLGPADPVVASALQDVARVLVTGKRYDEARPLLARAVTILEGAHGATHGKVSQALVLLAKLENSAKNLDQAEQHFERAYRIIHDALGPDDKSLRAILYSLGGVYFDQGKYDAAEKSYKRAIALMGKEKGTQDLYYVLQHHALVKVHIAKKRYDEAEILLREMQTYFEGKPLKDKKRWLPGVLTSLAGVLRSQGNEEGARKLEEEARQLKGGVQGV